MRQRDRHSGADAESRSQTGAPLPATLAPRRLANRWACRLLTQTLFVSVLLWSRVAQAEVGSAVSPVFTVDTHWEFGVGDSVSSIFTVDTRWGFGAGSGLSGFFTINTRFSGSAGEGTSGLFTVDRVGAYVGNALIAGYVTDTNGASLAGATVSALQNNVVRVQAGTDASGYYQLNLLPAGAYQLRAEKANYLTGLRYGVNLSPSQTRIEHFALAGKPSGPAVQIVTRPAESANLPTVPGPQLKMFVNGAFVVGGPFDAAKPTVIVTHGWNSDPTKWAEGMAAKMIAGGANANILAWDWWQEANKALSKATTATLREGTKLGETLATTFTPSYNQGVHFIGHSLGTLVNATAANYLHANGYSYTKTHMTLLDDAEMANQTTGATFVSPIPQQRAWIDNYVSLVGVYHPEAVNTLLIKSPYYADHSNPVALVTSLHNYACHWYGDTGATPSQSVLGNRYSFEQLRSAALFPSPNPYPLGAIFSQDSLASQELLLQRVQTEADLKLAVSVWALGLVGFGLESPLSFANGVAQKAGVVAVNVAESFIPRTPTGTPVFTGTAGSTPAYYTGNGIEETPLWSFQVNLQTTPPASFAAQRIHPLGADPEPQDAGEAGNETPRVWIPVAVPPNAALFCFDFSLTGDSGDDLFAVNIAEMNVFALETRFLPTNTMMNSGPIDVSAWAGQTVEFFFGVLGGTSTNANLTLSGMRFYQIEAPALNIEIAGTTVLISWPATVQGYQLETTTNPAAGSAWTTVTNTPALVGLRSVVTNSVLSGERFYRLKKIPTAPALNIQRANNEVLISWPASIQGYQLETTTNLAAGDSWFAVPNPPMLGELQNVVTNPISGGARFFRLKK